MRYAGFWPRLGALIIDTIVMAPLIWLAFWALSTSRTWAVMVQLSATVLFAFYNIYFIGRWGQTIGKMALGIKVVALDGSEAGFGRAFYRQSVDLGLSVLTTVLTVHALLSVSGTLYDAASLAQKMQMLGEYTPSWNTAIDALSVAWAASELVVLLFNAKRRALHDFIAGTVVVHEQGKVVEA